LTKDTNKQRRLIVLSGPSGSGKATLLQYVTEHSDILRVVTYTTRKPRPGEVDGRDYHFVSKADFDRMYRDGELIEAEQVYGDYFYGSPKDIFAGAPSDVIMELDTKGAENYRKFYPNLITVFILPPSIEELVRRIESRHPEANLKERLRAAGQQIEVAQQYDFIIVNDEIERAGAELLQIIDSGKSDTSRDEMIQHSQQLVKSAHRDWA
jgi:guanylate kinase